MARKAKRARVIVPPASGRGRELSELRRSNAAGRHGKHGKDRANTRRAAIDFARI